RPDVGHVAGCLAVSLPRALVLKPPAGAAAPPGGGTWWGGAAVPPPGRGRVRVDRSLRRGAIRGERCQRTGARGSLPGDARETPMNDREAATTRSASDEGSREVLT